MGKTNKKQKEKEKSIPFAHVGDKEKRSLFSYQDEQKLRDLANERISFSFDFFNRTPEEFNLGGLKDGWFLSFLERLKSLSGFTVSQFKDPQTQERLHIHTHSWDLIEEKITNIPKLLIDQLGEDKFYQVSISQATGRIHGFFIKNNIFCIVWLDPHHQMYPMRKVRTFKPLKSEYELLEEQLKECQKTNQELEEMMDDLTKPPGG